MIRRRPALGALAGAWFAAALPGAALPVAALPGAARAAAADAFLAWSGDTAWVALRSGRLQAMAGIAVPPVPVAGGLWSAGPGGLLRRWRFAADEGGLAVAAQQQADAPLHALAADASGQWALAAVGEGLLLLDADARVVRRYDGTDLARQRRGRASVLFALPQRRSFVAAWPALGELWEISLDPDAPPIFEGLVHDYRMGEAIASPGYLGVRRTVVRAPLPAMGFADARVPWLAGVAADGVEVLHLDVRRRIASLPVAGARPAAALLRREGSALRWWLPAANEVHVIDTSRWQALARHALPGDVRALQALDDTVWALAGAADAAADAGGLWRWRGEGWQPVPGPAAGGRPVALAADAPARQLLLATAQPAALHRLDAEGRGLARWDLPAGSRVEGLRAWPGD